MELVCGELRSPVTRVWDSIEQVCHKKLKVSVRLHIKTLMHIIGIILSPYHDHTNYHLKFTFCLHSETDQQIYDDIVVCVVFSVVSFSLCGIASQSMNLSQFISELNIIITFERENIYYCLIGEAVRALALS